MFHDAGVCHVVVCSLAQACFPSMSYTWHVRLVDTMRCIEPSRERCIGGVKVERNVFEKECAPLEWFRRSGSAACCHCMASDGGSNCCGGEFGQTQVQYRIEE